jgi:hypothetical protein
MGDRPTASKPAAPPVTQPPASASGSPHPVAHETTARVATQKTPLPSFFWGALGCVSVLTVGFTVLFVVARPGAAAVTLPPPVPLPPPAAVTAPPPPPRPSPDIQPMAPPAAPPAAPVEAPAAHAKPVVVHPVKVARAPSASEAGGVAAVTKKKAPKTADQTDDSSDDGATANSTANSTAKKKATDSPAAAADKPADQKAADDDQPAPRHRERASDDPDDD